jgi:Uma2 family endonuclease
MSIVTQERWQWTAPRYFQAVESGLINPDERLELIEGELIRMAPINPRHANVVTKLTQILSAKLDTTAFHLRVQQPLAFVEDTWPEPDLAIIRAGDYDDRHPVAADTLLVIEVADSSFPFDRGKKAILYAGHSIPEYWVVDVRRAPVKANTLIYVHRNPLPDGYQRIAEYERGRIEAEAVAGVAIEDVGSL